MRIHYTLVATLLGVAFTAQAAITADQAKVSAPNSSRPTLPIST
jgi:hypothetical protein